MMYRKWQVVGEGGNQDNPKVSDLCNQMLVSSPETGNSPRRLCGGRLQLQLHIGELEMSFKCPRTCRP